MNIPLNIDWQQILLHLFNFAILAGGLYFLLYKPVLGFMEKREAYYREQDEAAAKKLKEATELKASYEKQLSEARTAIEEERLRASKENEEEAKRQLSEAREQADRIIRAARDEADRVAERQLHESQEAMKELVASAAERLMLKNDDQAIEMFLNSVEHKHEATPEKAASRVTEQTIKEDASEEPAKEKLKEADRLADTKEARA